MQKSPLPVDVRAGSAGAPGGTGVGKRPGRACSQAIFARYSLFVIQRGTDNETSLDIFFLFRCAIRTAFE